MQDEGSAKGRAAAAASGAVADVEAARASDALEALEGILPAAAEQLMALVAEHAAAGPGSGFAARQLLAIAACCVDLSDAAARKAASELVQVRCPHEPFSILLSFIASLPRSTAMHNPGLGTPAKACNCTSLRLGQICLNLLHQVLAATCGKKASWPLKYAAVRRASW